MLFWCLWIDIDCKCILYSVSPHMEVFQQSVLLMFLQAVEELEKQFATELQQLKSAAEEKHHKVKGGVLRM